MNSTKVCPDCGAEKPLIDFDLSHRKGTGHKKRCRHCLAIKTDNRRGRKSGAAAGVDVGELRQAGLKWCSGCQSVKSIDRFYGNQRSLDGLSWDCIDCRRLYDRQHIRRSPEARELRKIRDREERRRRAESEGRQFRSTEERIREAGHLRKRRKLKWEDLERMLAEQDQHCAICGRDFSNGFHIDHCHRTGKIRGLLCMRCNLGLGWFLDDPESLHSAAGYIQKYKNAGPSL